MKHNFNIRMKYKGLLLIVAATLYFSCDIKDPIYDYGNITLVTDWSKRTEGVEIPKSYTVIINNQELNFTEPTNLLPSFKEDTYSTLIYNTAEKITKEGATITVQTNNNQVAPLPGWLFSSVLDIAYTYDTKKTITAVMQQQIHQLTLILKPTGDTADYIENIAASLSGVAASWDLITNEAKGEEKSVPLTFEKQENGTWKVKARLLGIMGNKQLLTGTITFKGELQNIPLESDLSADLIGFNEGKHNPLSLGGDIETHIEAGFSATINAWTVITDEGIAW